MARATQKKKGVHGKGSGAKTVIATNLVPATSAKTRSLDEIAKERGFSQAIFLKQNPTTGLKEAFSRCSKCGMVGSCKLLEEQAIQIEGVPFRLAIARCFWMEHNFRILMSV